MGTKCIQHAFADGSTRQPRKNVTCVKFGNRGDKLVASYHGDHAYAFNTSISGETKPVVSYSSCLASQRVLTQNGKRARVAESVR